MAIGIVISGACGRMGRAIARCALQDRRFSVAGALEAPGHPAAGTEYGRTLGAADEGGVRVETDARAAIARGDLVIEFTTPEATLAHAELAAALGKPIVIGTTGLSDGQLAGLGGVARRIPVLVSPNMSIGVNVLCGLAEAAARQLGAAYDIEIVESHHRQKQDAPSGTAKRLARVIETARGEKPGSVPVHAVRAGDIIGDHTVMFAGPAERLELTHRAHSREVFAQGALKAAQFVVGKKPGFYDMSDVLKQTH